ncbi:MAG: hypothetical protein FWH27_17365, partial [Planctomycetaceae bacterium]|nr:hypothetical protein [Planctomycetaceae bacterium]
MSDFGNIFLSRNDLDSLSVPKNRLEPQYADTYHVWREKKDDTSRENLLQTITPAIERTVRGIHGADPNYMKLQGKILAMKAMDRYDPEQSSLETYLTHQLMPLRRKARQQMNVLSIPDRLLMASQQLESAETELQDELGRMPTTLELSDRLHISAKQIERIRRMTHARNTGSYLTPDDEGTVGGNMEVARNLRHCHTPKIFVSRLTAADCILRMSSSMPEPPERRAIWFAARNCRCIKVRSRIL